MPLRCVDGELEVDAALKSSFGVRSCARDFDDDDVEADTAPCPYVCECQKKCEKGQPDSFITWTLLCSFVGLLILYYLVNSCAVALTARVSPPSARVSASSVRVSASSARVSASSARVSAASQLDPEAVQ